VRDICAVQLCCRSLHRYCYCEMKCRCQKSMAVSKRVIPLYGYYCIRSSAVCPRRVRCSSSPSLSLSLHLYLSSFLYTRLFGAGRVNCSSVASRGRLSSTFMATFTTASCCVSPVSDPYSNIIICCLIHCNLPMSVTHKQHRSGSD
jgi:hypothetical protein